MEATAASARPGVPEGAPGEVDELISRVQRLTEEVERIEDPRARRTAEELLAAVLELHGEGLARIGRALDEAGEAGVAVKGEMLEDGVISSLLLIHDLYPVGLEERVREALDGVRPYMESHGGDVDLLGLEDGVARIRLQGSCDGCPASASTLELAIKQALEETAPDLIGLEVEGMTEAEPMPGENISGTPLPVINVSPNGEGGNGANGAANGAAAEVGTEPRTRSRWLQPAGLRRPADGEVSVADADGMRIVVANVSGSLLAFRDACPSCESEMSSGQLKGGVLACPACERRYYLPRAGRSMDAEKLLLEPVPLLDQGGVVTVAVGA
jgi:Fe-S cluster biogenesis protein NfuA/nitrite reductase/ring-hydroxylating ferredoxin subunit